MSGNSTQFALNLGQESWAAALRPGAVAGLFVVGVILGRLASGLGIPGPAADFDRRSCPAWRVGDAGAPQLYPGRSYDDRHGRAERDPAATWSPKIGLTYVTGTLVSLGERFADALRGAGRFSACLPVAFLWLGLVAGGAAGAASFSAFGARSLAAPAGAVLLLAAAALVEVKRGQNR